MARLTRHELPLNNFRRRTGGAIGCGIAEFWHLQEGKIRAHYRLRENSFVKGKAISISLRSMALRACLIY